MPHKPRVYVSGPMSGIASYNFEAFDHAADKLRQHGYRVINPADFGADPKHSWKDCLCRDLAMLAHVDIVATLPNWAMSEGASLEVRTARDLGIRVTTVIELLQGPVPKTVCATPSEAPATKSRLRKLSVWLGFPIAG